MMLAVVRCHLTSVLLLQAPHGKLQVGARHWGLGAMTPPTLYLRKIDAWVCCECTIHARAS